MILESKTPKRVLLFEDNRDDEELALRALRTCATPLTVTVARDGKLALNALTRCVSQPSETPHLVISDLKMPKINGDVLVQTARTYPSLKDTPYLIFSSSDDPGDARRCLASGATAYYKKPVAFDEYMDCLRTVVGKYLSGEPDSPVPSCKLDGTEISPINRRMSY